MAPIAFTDAAKKIATEFEFTDDQVRAAVKHFLAQMEEGLQQDGKSLSQIPTYVTGVPDGTEKGLYLAVDLGGTNFRVCSVKLNGDTTFNIVQSKVAIPKPIMEAKTASELFAFLAKQIENFLREHHGEHYQSNVRRRQTVSTPEGYRDEEIFKLGMTFSFPVKQIGINKGTLIRWTKGFNIQDVVGKDVCELLQREIDILRLPVKVAALVNDTVGTLMSRSYTSPGKTPTLLGAIFGTGTNGAYVEKLENIKKPLEGDYDKTSGLMVVNTEWGSFDNELKVLPFTKYDKQLDAESNNPGLQMFEKQISGMFLGELLRLVILDMNKNSNLFVDKNSKDNDLSSTTNILRDSPLYVSGAVDSAILSIAEADNSDGLKALRLQIEDSLKVDSPSLEDAQAVKIIAHAIAKRAARLAGVAVAGIVLQSGRLESTSSIPQVDGSMFSKTSDENAPIRDDEIVDIGVDGSLVEFYPGFKTHMRAAIRVVEGFGKRNEERVRTGIAKDGSGVGAALIALVADGMEKANAGVGAKAKGVVEDLKAKVLGVQA